MCDSISNLKQHEFLLWERPPGRDKLDRGRRPLHQSAAFKLEME